MSEYRAIDLDGLLAYIKEAATAIGSKIGPESDWQPFAWLQAPERQTMVVVELKEFWSEGGEGREIATLALAAAAKQLPADLFGIVSSAWFMGDLEALAEGREPEPLPEGAAEHADREGVESLGALRREGLVVEVCDAGSRIVEIGLVTRGGEHPEVGPWLRMPDQYESRFSGHVQPHLVTA